MGALEGKVVVVTGASRGIGEAIAVAYASEGADLVLAARTVDDLDRVAKSCTAAGAASVTIARTDVTSEADVERLVADTVARAGRLDVFVANAGTSYGMLTDKRYAQLWTYDLDIAEQILRVNGIGTWLCLKHAIPAMREGGSVIVVGSETGRALRPGSGWYAISKGTTEALATMASRETADLGIRVNLLSPGGMVDTQLFGPTGMSEQLKQHAPPLPAEIIAAPAIWLASDDSIGVTGALLSGRAWSSKTPDEWKQELSA